jgi:uncharacterized protein involved in exopolysaccharide biosynthesis
VIRKLLESLFRYKFLLLVPPILIPLIVTPIAVMANPPLYESSVSVWVDRPAYLSSQADGSTWMTGVQTQSNRLNELLRTRAFLDSVAQRTSLAPLVGNPVGEARIADIINRSVSIGSPAGGPAGGSSEHLLIVHAQANSAALSVELCKAIVDAYQEKAAADQSDQASVAAQFYQSQLQDAKQQLTKATNDLRRYVASQQTDGTSDSLGDPTQPGAIPLAMVDSKLASLQGNVQAAQNAVQTAQSSLAQAQQDAMVAQEGQQYGFQVLDDAQLPTAATPQTKKIMIYPIASLLAGLGLSCLLLVLLVASDRSIRSETDLAPGVRVLGALPNFEARRVPRSLRQVATRRAIGAVAGMALPMPQGSK